MRTAMNEDESTRVAPDTTKWGLPYGHFPIGELIFIIIGLTLQIKLTNLAYNTPNERSWNELSSRTLSQHASSNQSCILRKCCWN